MGQYYMIGNASKRESILKDGCGAKLMETSWVNNSAIGELYNHLMNDWYGDVVVNIGDYAADDENNTEKLKKICKESKTKGIENLYREMQEAWTIVNEDEDDNDWIQRGELGVLYGVNLDKKEYIDLNILPVNETYVFGSEEEEDIYESIYIIEPIALLIAVGNGMGGGDYRWGNNVEEVGRWAGDRIGIVSDNPPDGYTEIKPDFRENEGEYLGHALCSRYPVYDSDYKPKNMLEKMERAWQERTPIFYIKDGKLVNNLIGEENKNIKKENKKLLEEIESLKKDLGAEKEKVKELKKKSEEDKADFDKRVEGIRKLIGDMVDLSDRLR